MKMFWSQVEMLIAQLSASKLLFILKWLMLCQFHPNKRKIKRKDSKGENEV